MITIDCLSLCSGIGGIDKAFEEEGYTITYQVELDKICNYILERHFKNANRTIRNITSADLFKIKRPRVIFGGTPCQGFSISGLRKSLDDSRSNLCRSYVALVDYHNPDIAVWEQVPGVLSTKDNAFGCFLAGLVGADAPLIPPRQQGGKRKWSRAGVVVGPKRTAAWRVFDSQYFGVAQRRERLVLVTDSIGGCSPEILFESDRLPRSNPPSREAGETTAGTLTKSFGDGGADDRRAALYVTGAITAGSGRRGYGVEEACAGHYIVEEVAGPVTGQDRHNHSAESAKNGHYIIKEVSPAVTSKWSKGRGGPSGDECQNLVAAPLTTKPYADHVSKENNIISHTLQASHDASEDGSGRGTPLVTQSISVIDTRSGHTDEDKTPTLRAQDNPNSNMDGAGHLAVAVRLGQTNANGAGVQPDAAYALDSANAQAVLPQSMRIETGPTCSTLDAQSGHNRGGSEGKKVFDGRLVRRLTPTECERLQAFPDGWTAWGIKNGERKKLKDSPRYKGLGNAVTTFVFQWVARRAKPYLKS